MVTNKYRALIGVGCLVLSILEPELTTQLAIGIAIANGVDLLKRQA